MYITLEFFLLFPLILPDSLHWFGEDALAFLESWKIIAFALILLIPLKLTYFYCFTMPDLKARRRFKRLTLWGFAAAILFAVIAGSILFFGVYAPQEEGIMPFITLVIHIIITTMLNYVFYYLLILAGFIMASYLIDKPWNIRTMRGYPFKRLLMRSKQRHTSH